MNEMKLSNMGNIFIEIFDIKVLYAIHPIVYISRQYGKKNYFLFENCY